MHKKQWLKWMALLPLALITSAVHGQETTPTPLQIQLVTETPAAAAGAESIVVTATWTPTQVGPVVLQALDIANVRRLPSTDETQVGVIRSGEFYNVNGRYFDWFRLEYEASPDGLGWVYGELVEISGDEASIPEVDPYGTTDQSAPASSDVTVLPGVIESGILATATAQSGQPSSSNGALATVTSGAILPTFTYPPGLIRPQPTDAAFDQQDEVFAETTTIPQTDLPPIAPILILGGLGLLGLALTSVRR